MRNFKDVIQEVRLEVKGSSAPLVESWDVLRRARVSPEEYAKMIQNKKLMDLITKELPKNYFFITDKEHRILNQNIPVPLQKELPLMIRTGASRLLTNVADVMREVDKIERSDDYIRDISIPATPRPEAWEIFPGFSM